MRLSQIIVHYLKKFGRRERCKRMNNTYAKVFKLLVLFWVIVIGFYLLNLLLQNVDTVQATLHDVEGWLKRYLSSVFS